MQQKVELVQIRSLGEVVDDSILFLKQNWKPLIKSYFVICGFFWIASLIISVFNQTKTFQLQDEGESVYSLTYFLTIFFSFINFTFISLTTLSYIAVYREKGNQAPAVGEVWGFVKYYLLRIFGGSIILMVLWVTGFFSCIIPGIYFTPIYLLIITIVVLENAGFSYAFSLGFQLIKEKWWYAFGALFVTSMIVVAALILFAIVAVLVVSVILLLTNLNHQHTQALAVTITLHSLQILYLLPTISIALTYFSLSEQKDDNSLMQRIEMLGKNNQNLDQLPTEEY